MSAPATRCNVARVDWPGAPRPDNAYVRRHVPELCQGPDRYARKPWTMPEDVQRECGCVIGVDYPAPIVDHARAREEALARYRV